MANLSGCKEFCLESVNLRRMDCISVATIINGDIGNEETSVYRHYGRRKGSPVVKEKPSHLD